jgi:ketosteroid isomerase-like protein
MLSNADREAIQKAFEHVMAMFGAPVKDWSAFVNLAYDRDAIVMAPNAPAIRGHKAIIAFWEAFPPVSDFNQESLEMEGLGDLALSRDEYWFTMTLPGQSALKDKGKAIMIWRKQADGSWKVFREIWNSDLPAPEA